MKYQVATRFETLQISNLEGMCFFCVSFAEVRILRETHDLPNPFTPNRYDQFVRVDSPTKKWVTGW